jgi:hypothetical protein
MQNSLTTAEEVQEWSMKDDEEPELMREIVTKEQILEYKQQKAAKAALMGGKGAVGGLGGFAAASATAEAVTHPAAVTAAAGPQGGVAGSGGQAAGSGVTNSLPHAPRSKNGAIKQTAAGAAGYPLSQMEVEEQELLRLEHQMQAKQIKGKGDTLEV